MTALILMTLVASPIDAPGRSADEMVLTDFAADSADFGWYALNDNVMGGRSDGTFELQQGKLVFTGSTNTNGGGFSSIRAEGMQLDLSACTGLRLRVKGDGRRYTWRLATPARWRGRQISYWAEFETAIGAWTTVDIPFASFIPKFRGSALDGPTLDRSLITGMGLMIYDNQDGPFELQLARISAW
jgi:NADH dehydrogenase [ubiquinone] 1 alpha subcomplex assembly factor 1